MSDMLFVFIINYVFNFWYIATDDDCYYCYDSNKITICISAQGWCVWWSYFILCVLSILILRVFAIV